MARVAAATAAAIAAGLLAEGEAEAEAEAGDVVCGFAANGFAAAPDGPAFASFFAPSSLSFAATNPLLHHGKGRLFPSPVSPFVSAVSAVSPVSPTPRAVSAARTHAAMAAAADSGSDRTRSTPAWSAAL